jgi:uncharacterized protein (DUF362 family)
MAVPVAVVRIDADYDTALRKALALLGGIESLNTAEREVTIKVGIFDHRSRHHATPAAVRALASAFDQAPRIHLAESDSYCGNAEERLEACYGDLFSERLIPASLSAGEMRQLPIAGEEMALSTTLLKPNVLVDVHVLRTFNRGSLLKNLFGCTPMAQKARFHKNEVFPVLLADIFEAAGGIDLAVIDGTYLFSNAAEKSVPAGLLLAGRDAVAVEAVGAMLAGLKPEKSLAIQEFMRRGLGEGDLANIEMLGISQVELGEMGKARKELKKLVESAPRLAGISDTIDRITGEGWMNDCRTVEEVVAELKARGVANAKKEVVETTLKRRTGKTLERINGGVGSTARTTLWLYRRKQD